MFNAVRGLVPDGSVLDEFQLGVDETGNSTLTNSGNIHGPIAMGGGVESLTNSGKITGSVTFTGTGDSLSNAGLIHGLVTLGTGDTFINTGSVHGNVVLGTGDTLDTSEGTITGNLADKARSFGIPVWRFGGDGA